MRDYGEDARSFFGGRAIDCGHLTASDGTHDCKSLGNIGNRELGRVGRRPGHF